MSYDYTYTTSDVRLLAGLRRGAALPYNNMTIRRAQAIRPTLFGLSSATRHHVRADVLAPRRSLATAEVDDNSSDRMAPTYGSGNNWWSDDSENTVATSRQRNMSKYFA